MYFPDMCNYCKRNSYGGLGKVLLEEQLHQTFEQLRLTQEQLRQAQARITQQHLLG